MLRSEELDLLHQLLARQRVLSMSVIVDDKPYVGLLPFVPSTAVCRGAQLAPRSSASTALLSSSRDSKTSDQLSSTEPGASRYRA